MRLLGKVALGGGLAATATTTWLVAAGVLATSATLVVADPVPDTARAGARPLTTFDSCAALRAWHLENALADVGPYGWEGRYGVYPMAQRGLAAAGTSDFAADAVETSASATGTNTQEASVDEPDVAKTNGTLVARIVDDRTLVLLDVTGSAPRVTARLNLPRTGFGNELLLVGTHVLVTQQTSSVVPSPERLSSDAMYGHPGRTATRLFDIDIADPTRPRILSRDRYSGRLLSARQYDGSVRLVTATPRPDVAWTYPSEQVSPREATRRNRAAVRALPVERWLPSVLRDGAREELLGCDQVLHPRTYAGSETVTVTTVETSDGIGSGKRSAVAITADGGVVYSSADRLYVATAEVSSTWARDLVGAPPRSTTALHAFDLTGARTAYVGSGAVAGFLRDRWSLDEHEGRLRVAWTRSGKQGRTSNGISILAERDGALVTTASVGDLGIEEDLQSVRWFDDLAVLVTYRQVDPLYTIDLSDQDRPRLRGALKIPGFSGYLHPVGENLLLGLGVRGDAAGNTSGAQAAVFDISDLDEPVRVSQSAFGTSTHFAAIDDPRGFTWLPATRTALTALVDWSTGARRLVGLEVGPSGTLDSRPVADLNEDWTSRTLPLADGRIAVLDRNRVRLLRG